MADIEPSAGSTGKEAKGVTNAAREASQRALQDAQQKARALPGKMKAAAAESKRQLPGQMKAGAKSVGAVAKALPGQTKAVAAQTKTAAINTYGQTKAAAVKGRSVAIQQIDKSRLPQPIKSRALKILKPTERETVQLPNMAGRVVIITGGNTGIGFEAAKSLMAAGAHVIIVGRSQARCTEAVAQLQEMAAQAEAGAGGQEDVSTGQQVAEGEQDAGAQPWGDVEYMLCDLASFGSIEAFASEFKSRGLPLHVLVHNAGVYLPPGGQTEEGFEPHLGVNHLGTFYLTLSLLDCLKDSAPSRVVIVSNPAAVSARLLGDELRPNSGRPTDRSSYAASRLFEIMAANELRTRLAQVGVDVLVCHPGVTKSDLQKRADRGRAGAKIKGALGSRSAQPSDLGALSMVYCAGHPDAVGEFGTWYGPDRRNKHNTACRPVINQLAQDPSWCKRMYEDTALAVRTALEAPPPAEVEEEGEAVAPPEPIVRRKSGKKELPPPLKTKKTGSAKFGTSPEATAAAAALPASSPSPGRSPSSSQQSLAAAADPAEVVKAPSMKRVASVKRRASLKGASPNSAKEAPPATPATAAAPAAAAAAAAAVGAGAVQEPVTPQRAVVDADEVEDDDDGSLVSSRSRKGSTGSGAAARPGRSPAAAPITPERA